MENAIPERMRKYIQGIVRHDAFEGVEWMKNQILDELRHRNVIGISVEETTRMTYEREFEVRGIERFWKRLEEIAHAE